MSMEGQIRDGLRPPSIEVMFDDDGLCRTTVYRYDQVLSEARKEAILVHLPGAKFTTRMRLVPTADGGEPVRDCFTEILEDYRR